MGREHKQQKQETSPNKDKQADNVLSEHPYQPTPGTLLYLQRTVGNRAVQNLLHQNRLQYSAKPSAGVSRIALKQNQSAIQREGNDANSASSLTFQGYTISTYGELSQFFKLYTLQLKSQEDELAKDNVASPSKLKDAIKQGTDLQKQYAAEPNTAMELVAGLVLQAWWDNHYIKGINEAEAVKAQEAARNIRKVKDEMDVAADKLEKEVVPQLREVQRSAFRGSDDNKLLEVADTIGTALDTALILKDTVIAIGDDIATLQNMANVARSSSGIYPTVNTKIAMITELADRVNKAYAAFQLARAAIGLVTGGKTESASAAKGVEAMSTLISAGGTLLGASAGFSMYANFYIGPMVSACLAMIAKIEDMRSKGLNRDLIQLGKFDSVNWLIEPGGRPVFNFMLAVMRAGDASGVPKPVPKEVSNYFTSNEGDFEAGTGGSDLPTSGWLWWEEVDADKIGNWVFKHRHNLWGMLYGDVAAPN
jgi:hypothetical protein